MPSYSEANFGCLCKSVPSGLSQGDAHNIRGLNKSIDLIMRGSGWEGACLETCPPRLPQVSVVGETTRPLACAPLSLLVDLYLFILLNIFISIFIYIYLIVIGPRSVVISSQYPPRLSLERWRRIFGNGCNLTVTPTREGGSKPHLHLKSIHCWEDSEHIK